jgi:hypothetical protein
MAQFDEQSIERDLPDLVLSWSPQRSSTLRRRKPDDASGDELAARSSSAPLAGGQCDPSNTLEMRQALLPEDGRHLDE